MSSRLTALLCVTFSLCGHAAVPLGRAADGHLTVPAYVNGTGPYPFILDTGADTGALYTWFARQLHLRADKPADLSGQTGSTLVPTYRLRSLSIDGRSLRDSTVYGLPDRHDAGREAGVAGNDLMDGAVVVFDFPCGQVEIHAKPAPLRALLPPDAIRVSGVPVKDGTVLSIPVEINGVAGAALVDTGSRDSRIGLQFAAALGIDASSAAFRDAEPVYGANSRAQGSRIGPVGTVRFGGITAPDVTARVMDLSALRSSGVGEKIMILGMDLMGPHRLVFDHEARTVWFGSSRCARAETGR
jgi:predicted aspartyl protease